MLEKMQSVALACACAGLFALLGCNSASSAASAKQAPKQPANAPAPAASARAVDQSLAHRIQRIAQGCHLTESKSLECDDGSQDRLALAKEFLAGKRSRVQALPTLVALIATDNAVLSVVVSELLAVGFAESFGDQVKPGDVPSEVTMGLIEAYNRFDEYRAHRIVPAVTHAAVLSGDVLKLYAALVAKKDLDGIYRMLRRLMVHGRLQYLDQVRRALDDRENIQLALAGMESMRYMPHWTSEEQTVLCPLVLSYLNGERPPLAARAAQTALNCHGAELTAVIAKLREWLDAGQFDGTVLVALYGRCREPEGSLEAQGDPAALRNDCEQTVAFLESVAGAKKLSEEVRAKALDVIATQLPTARAIEEPFAENLVKRIHKRFARDRSDLVTRAAQGIKVEL